MTTTNEPTGIDLDNAALDKLEALARAVDDLPETTQPFVSMGGQVVIHTFSMSPEQVRAVANLYDAATPATIVALIALARRAPAPVVDERAMFEEWFATKLREQYPKLSDEGVQCRFWQNDIGEYRDMWVARDWAAWQARAALAQQSPAPVVAHDAPAAPASAQPDRGAAPAGMTEREAFIWTLGRNAGREEASASGERCAHCKRLPGDPEGMCDWMECPVGSVPSTGTCASEEAMFEAWCAYTQDLPTFLPVESSAAIRAVRWARAAWHGRAALIQKYAANHPLLPAGYTWAPIEPTEAMVHAAEDLPAPRMFGQVYRAMLVAAVSPASQPVAPVGKEDSDE